VGIERAFVHTATVVRPTAGTADSLNQPTSGTPITLYTALPGRLVERQERVAKDAWVTSVLVTTYIYIMGAEVDVQERDLITSITLEDGSVLTQTFQIKQVLRRVNSNAAHHKAAMLEAVS
jgi:hypothetical protein